MNVLKKIWENKAQILEGITNTLMKDKFVEEVAKNRRAICDDCTNKGTECAVKGTAPCCNLCGCSLTFKSRSLSSDCPDGKWDAILTEEEEDELDNLKD